MRTFALALFVLAASLVNATNLRGGDDDLSKAVQRALQGGNSLMICEIPGLNLETWLFMAPYQGTSKEQALADWNACMDAVNGSLRTETFKHQCHGTVAAWRANLLETSMECQVGGDCPNGVCFWDKHGSYCSKFVTETGKKPQCGQPKPAGYEDLP